MSRQKVRPAMQLISSSAAHCMRHFLTDGDYTEEARVVQLFDDVCDILNSASPADPKTLRRGYKATEQQEAVLDAAIEELLIMRFGSAQHLYPFQKAMLVTIRSVRGLLGDMRTAFGEATYLLTRCLTQDQLEGLFGSVRGRSGSNSNPNPVDAMASMRLLTILFGLNCGVSPLRKPARVTEQGSPAGTEPGTDAKAEQVPSELEQLQELQQEFSVAVPEEVDADLREFAAMPAGGEQPLTVDDDGPTTDEPAEPDPVIEFPYPESQSGAGDTAPSGTEASEAGSAAGPSATDCAMAYVCGFVARKDPSLGAPSSQTEDGPLEAVWVRVRSEGGLTIPTDDFYRKFLQMDEEFRLHHMLEPDQLSRKPRVVADFLAVLMRKFPTVPTAAMKTFARTRTFMRMKAVNCSRSATAESLAKRAARKRKQCAT